MKLFNIGDMVEVIEESHGWGEVTRGDIGEIIGSYEKGEVYYVNFPNHSGWVGHEWCFKLINTPIKFELPDHLFEVD